MNDQATEIVQLLREIRDLLAVKEMDPVVPRERPKRQVVVRARESEPKEELSGRLCGSRASRSTSGWQASW